MDKSFNKTGAPNNWVGAKDLRTFWLIWTIIFILISLYPLLKWWDLRIWSTWVSLVFFLVSILTPSILRIFYDAWIKFWWVMGWINSRLIMFILFYWIFCPIAILLKIFRIDLLNKRIDKSIDSYWINRESQPGDQKFQF